jgi:hypothetical protein
MISSNTSIRTSYTKLSTWFYQDLKKRKKEFNLESETSYLAKE